MFILLSILILAFIFEYIDSSIGMGYGTILAPFLIIAGYPPLIVVPSILISQGIASISAAFFHVKYKNIDLHYKGNTKIVLLILGIGGPIIILSFLILPGLSDIYRELYIAIVTVAMGIILLAKKRFSYSLRNLSLVGVISVFNKAITGGGFGPVFTSGQIISGKRTKSAIALTILLEAPLCIISFIAYYIVFGAIELALPLTLSLGALFATPLGPLRTSEFKESGGRTMVGIFCFSLGIFVIVKIFVWSYVTVFIFDVFFWALISMFALIGSSATLVSRQLARFPRINQSFVILFALGRVLIVLPFCPQPRFEMAGFNEFIGLIIFIMGLIFLIPLFQINPWPAPNDKMDLVTTGFYGIVRNPIYLGEILWSLGLAIIFGSVIGVALIPLWWGGLLFHVVLEEEELERKMGKQYLRYKAKVRGRIIPGLPI